MGMTSGTTSVERMDGMTVVCMINRGVGKIGNGNGGGTELRFRMGAVGKAPRARLRT